VVYRHAGGRVIRTTDEHRFYVSDRGWVPVAEPFGWPAGIHAAQMGPGGRAGGTKPDDLWPHV
jgi:hypothetical protein